MEISLLTTVDITVVITSVAVVVAQVWYAKKFDTINTHVIGIGKMLMHSAKSMALGLFNAAPLLITLAIARTRFSGSTPSTHADLFELFMLCTWMSLFVAMFAIRVLVHARRDEAR